MSLLLNCPSSIFSVLFFFPPNLLFICQAVKFLLHAQCSFVPSTSSLPPSLVFSPVDKQSSFMPEKKERNCSRFTLKRVLSVREQSCPGEARLCVWVCVRVWVCGPEVAMVTFNQFPTPSNAQHQVPNNWLSLMFACRRRAGVFWYSALAAALVSLSEFQSCYV